MEHPTQTPGLTDTLRFPGTLALFGFSPTPAVVEAVPRSRAWRGTRAAAFLGTGLALAPLLGVVPPHAPWALGALSFGAFFGLRKWRERFTLLSLQGLCPKCGGAVRVIRGTPLRQNLSVPCEGCHHDARLEISFSPAESPISPQDAPRASTKTPPSPDGGTYR